MRQAIGGLWCLVNRSLRASARSDWTVPSVSRASSRNCLLASLLKNPAICTRPTRDGAAPLASSAGFGCPAAAFRTSFMLGLAGFFVMVLHLVTLTCRHAYALVDPLPERGNLGRRLAVGLDLAGCLAAHQGAREGDPLADNDRAHLHAIGLTDRLGRLGCLATDRRGRVDDDGGRLARQLCDLRRP